MLEFKTMYIHHIHRREHRLGKKQKTVKLLLSHHVSQIMLLYIIIVIFLPSLRLEVNLRSLVLHVELCNYVKYVLITLEILE